MGRSKLKTCAWCHKPTNLPEVFAADSPILEWFEKKIEVFCNSNNIDKRDLWGVEADWDRVKLTEQMEAELLTYDELLISVSDLSTKFKVFSVILKSSVLKVS